MSAAMHHCHAFKCAVKVAPRFLMCPKHWRMVPLVLQRLIWKHYRPGQENDKNPSDAYVLAQRAVVWCVAVKDGHYNIQDVPAVGSYAFIRGPVVSANETIKC